MVEEIKEEELEEDHPDTNVFVLRFGCLHKDFETENR